MSRLIEILPNLYQWTDICNVYVLKDGDSALLIDLGDGSVLDALEKIGIKKVEWVLFTHHHREQCLGADRLAKWGAKVGVPAGEKAFFETPTQFRKWSPTLNDPFSVYGPSYVRPPIEPIQVDQTFRKMDDFTWHGHEIWCIETAGNSPKHMTYLLNIKQQRVAFSGDLMMSGAKMHTWYDTEWDYGFAIGLYALGNSAALLASYRPDLMLPSHGPIIRDAHAQLNTYIGKLRKLGDIYVRGWEVKTFAGCDQDNYSKPTEVPHVFQVTPHLFKFRGPEFWPNFTLLIAKNGHGLIIDCGLFEEEFLDKSIALMQKRLGLKQIDAIFVTHMHGDHILQSPYVRKKWGAKLWTMEGIADKFERPNDFDYAAMIPAYGKGIDSVTFDRVVKNGSTIEWEEYRLTVDWMPGQTKYAACIHGEIDGKRVAFTGDNIFASPTNPRQAGNEAVVARNDCIFEEGYLYAADYLHHIGPDLLIGGHSWVMDKPTELIERYRQRALDLREAYRGLSAEPDYRLMYDPYWVRSDPYRVAIKAGGTGETTVRIRNFLPEAKNYQVKLICPKGLAAEPSNIEVKVPAEMSAPIAVKLKADRAMKEGIYMVAFDIQIDGKRYGPLFDFVVKVANS